MLKRLIFSPAIEVMNPGDDSRSFRFSFSVVAADLAGAPEEVRATTEHRLIVTVAKNRLPAWGYSEPELIKVLFEIGSREVFKKVRSATLQLETRVLVHTDTHSSTRPFDPTRIVNPEGAVFEVYEERRIGFK